MQRLAVASLVLLACNDAPPFTTYVSGTRLRAEVYDVDGVRRLHGWFDSQRQEECLFDQTGSPDGVHYCLPTDAEQVQAYSDSACTQPVHLHFGNSTLPKYLVQMPRSSCTEQPTVHLLGATMSLTTVYSFNGTCSGGGSTTATAIYGPGDPVGLDQLVAGRESVVRRGGRISSFGFDTDDGARQVISGWDEDRQEPVAYGSNWVPTHLAYAISELVAFYSDAACTTRVGAVFVSAGALCPTLSVQGDDTYGKAGAAVSPDSVYTPSNGGCVPITGDRRDFSFFQIGAPTPVSALEPTTLVKLGGAQGGRVLGIYAADGAQRPVTFARDFYDRQRDENCDVATASDGTLRCLPFFDSSGWDFGFSDPACTQPALATGGSPPALIETIAGGRTSVHTLGPQVPAFYVDNGAGNCSALNSPAWAIGDEIPPSQFEPASDVRE